MRNTKVGGFGNNTLRTADYSGRADAGMQSERQEERGRWGGGRDTQAASAIWKQNKTLTAKHMRSDIRHSIGVSTASD